ncbi:MAG: FMN-binding protein [bacterium]
MNLSKSRGIVFWILFSLTLCFTTVSEGWAEVYLTQEQALKIAFPKAEEIETVTLSLDQELKIRIEKRAQTPVRFSEIPVYIGKTQGRPIGYAMIHDVKGKARPITYMVVINPQGRVERVEILAYRESHGYEVRYPSFLKQFFGKLLADPIRIKRDIQNISGATISCRAIADGVRLLLGVWEEFYGKEVVP